MIFCSFAIFIFQNILRDFSKNKSQGCTMTYKGTSSIEFPTTLFSSSYTLSPLAFLVFSKTCQAFNSKYTCQGLCSACSLWLKCNSQNPLVVHSLPSYKFVLKIISHREHHTPHFSSFIYIYFAL